MPAGDYVVEIRVSKYRESVGKVSEHNLLQKKAGAQQTVSYDKCISGADAIAAPAIIQTDAISNLVLKTGCNLDTWHGQGRSRSALNLNLQGSSSSMAPGLEATSGKETRFVERSAYHSISGIWQFWHNFCTVI
jgi:hypothetical protein